MRLKIHRNNMVVMVIIYDIAKNVGGFEIYFYIKIVCDIIKLLWHSWH